MLFFVRCWDIRSGLQLNPYEYLIFGQVSGLWYDACVAVKIFRGALYGYVRFAQLMAEDLQALSQQEFGGEFIASDELFGLSEYFDAQISKLSEPVERIQDALEALRKEVSVQLERRTRGDEVWDIRLLDYMIGFFEISGDVPDRTEGGGNSKPYFMCSQADVEAPGAKLRGATNVGKGAARIFEVIWRGEFMFYRKGDEMFQRY